MQADIASVRICLGSRNAIRREIARLARLPEPERTIRWTGEEPLVPGDRLRGGTGAGMIEAAVVSAGAAGGLRSDGELQLRILRPGGPNTPLQPGEVVVYTAGSLVLAGCERATWSDERLRELELARHESIPTDFCRLPCNEPVRGDRIAWTEDAGEGRVRTVEAKVEARVDDILYDTLRRDRDRVPANASSRGDHGNAWVLWAGRSSLRAPSVLWTGRYARAEASGKGGPLTACPARAYRFRCIHRSRWHSIFAQIVEHGSQVVLSVENRKRHRIEGKEFAVARVVAHSEPAACFDRPMDVHPRRQHCKQASRLRTDTYKQLSALMSASRNWKNRCFDVSAVAIWRSSGSRAGLKSERGSPKIHQLSR